MSERVNAPSPLPSLTTPEVSDAFKRLRTFDHTNHTKELERELPIFTSSVMGMRALSTEWDVLFGSSTPDAYKRGITAGILLAETFRMRAIPLSEATSFALSESMAHEPDQIRYPYNPDIDLAFKQRLVYARHTRDLIEQAKSLYRGILGPFSKREPAVAAYIYHTSLDAGHKSREALVNLGIMDALDTFRARAMSRPHKPF